MAVMQEPEGTIWFEGPKISHSLISTMFVSCRIPAKQMTSFWLLYNVIEIRLCLKAYGADIKKGKEPKWNILKLSKRCNMGNKYNHQLLGDKIWHFIKEPYSILTGLKSHPCNKTKPEN